MSAGNPQEAGSGVQALLAAERLLVSTAESIDPGTPASELLGYVACYRAHLAALASAWRLPGKPHPET